MLGSPKPKKILVPSTIVPRYIFSGIASLPNPTHSFNFLDALEKEKLTPFWYFLLCLFFHNFHFINPLFFLTFHNISYSIYVDSFYNSPFFIIFHNITYSIYVDSFYNFPFFWTFHSISYSIYVDSFYNSPFFIIFHSKYIDSTHEYPF